MNQINYQHLMVKEGSHSIMQFDVTYLSDAIARYPHIAEQVNAKFVFINLNMLLSKDELYTNIDRDMRQYPNITLPRDTYSTFNNKFYIRNHMFSVNMSLRDSDNNCKSIDIPIDELYLYTECAYYSKKRTPSMVLFVNRSTSTGIFTRGGKMNLVGGYTQYEVKYALIMFLGRIEDGIKKYYQTSTLSIEVTQLKLENYVVSSKLPYSKIDIYNASKYIDAQKIPKIFVPEHCNLLNIRPFSNAAPSIHIRIFPTGGVVLTGCKSLFEISIAIQFLAAVINRFIVTNYPRNHTSMTTWLKEREVRMSKRETMKLKQMQKKRKKWEEQKKNRATQAGIASTTVDLPPLKKRMIDLNNNAQSVST